jgi:hypothetical protein
MALPFDLFFRRVTLPDLTGLAGYSKVEVACAGWRFDGYRDRLAAVETNLA